MTEATPASDRSERMMTAGLVVGIAIALGEGLTDFALPAAPFSLDTSGRLALIAPLPLLGLGVGLLLGRAYWIVVLALAWLAARVGQILVLGQLALTLPLAESWDILAAAGTLIAFAACRWFPHRTPFARWSRRFGLAALLALGLGIAFVERGHYRPIREGGLVVVATLAIALLGPALPPLRKKKGAALVLLCGVLAALGAMRCLQNDRASEWAHHRMSLPTTYARPLWMHLGERPRIEVEEDVLASRPLSYCGSPLAQKTTEQLFPSGRPRGVLMVTIDALRADLLDREVGGRAVAPFLSGLAAKGFRFNRAYTPANLTSAAFASIFSGRTPNDIRERLNSRREVRLVTRSLRDQQVVCRGHFFHVAAQGLAPSGAPRGTLGFAPEYQVGMTDPSAEELADLLAPDASTPWFSFLHLMTPHWPYAPRAPFRAGETAFERYCGEVRQADDTLRRLIESLERSPDAGEFWVIVASDHGEEFREHGLRYHGLQLFEETTRVPLIIAGAGVPQGAFNDPVSLTDLAPTLLDIFGVPAKEEPRRARSLLPLVAGLEDSERLPAVMIEMPDLTQSIQARALVRRDRKTIVQQARGTIQHYDLKADPEEKKDISEKRPANVHNDLRALSVLKHVDFGDAPEQGEGSEFDLDWDRLHTIERNNGSTDDDDLRIRSLLNASVLSRSEASRRLERCGDDPLLRDILSVAAGRDEKALRWRLLKELRQTQEATAAVAIYAMLTRLNDSGAMPLRRAEVADRRAQLAIDLARASYLSLRGPREANFRLVESSARVSNLWLRRLGAEYMAVASLEYHQPEVRAGIVEALRTSTSTWHRVALLRTLANPPGAEFPGVRDEVWRQGSREEQGALAHLIARGAPAAETTFLFRGEGEPPAFPPSQLKVPATAKTLWIVPALPPQSDGPLPLRFRIDDTVFDLDAAECRPGGALKIALPPSPRGGDEISISFVLQAKGPASARCGLIGLLARP